MICAPALQYSTATANAHLIQIPEQGFQGAAVTARQLSSMHHTRAFCNSVVLPDGRVAVFGGQVRRSTSVPYYKSPPLHLLAI